MLSINLAKSRKYRAIFKVKRSRKSRHVFFEGGGRGYLYNNREHMQVPKGGQNQVSIMGKWYMLVCHIRCKCSIETSRNSVKVKFCIKVILFVLSSRNSKNSDLSKRYLSMSIYSCHLTGISCWKRQPQIRSSLPAAEHISRDEVALYWGQSKTERNDMEIW